MKSYPSAFARQTILSRELDFWQLTCRKERLVKCYHVMKNILNSAYIVAKASNALFIDYFYSA